MTHGHLLSPELQRFIWAVNTPDVLRLLRKRHGQMPKKRRS